MGKKLAAGMVLLAIALGGGWLVLRQVADNRLQDAIAQFRASLGPDGSFTYASAESAPLDLGAVFTDATIRKNGAVARAARVTLEHVGRNRIGSAQLQNVQFQGNGVSGSASSIDGDNLSNPSGKKTPEWKDLQIGRLRLHELAVQPDKAGGLGARAAETDLSQTLDRRGGAVENTRMARLSIQDSGGQPLVTIDRLDAHAATSPDAISSTTDIAGLVIPPGSDLGQKLGQIGYRGATTGAGHVVIRFGQDGLPPSGRLAMDPLMIRLDGIGQLALAFDLDRLPPVSGQDPATTQWNERLAQVRLTGLTLTYDDAGLASHAMGQMARRSGMTDTQFRTAVVQTLQQRAAMDGGRGFEAEAIRFLNDPRHLVITMHPPAPLAMSDLAALRTPGGPADAIQALGLSVKAD